MPPTLDSALTFSADSLLISAADPPPARTILSSRDMGWSSLLLDLIESTGNTDAHDRTLTPDLMLVAGMRGVWDVSVRYGKRWANATFHAGAITVVRGRQETRMRWSNRGQTPFRFARVYLPPVFVAEAAEQFRRPGQTLQTEPPTSFAIDDRAIAGTVSALLHAATNGGSELYAEQAARWLATHLIHVHGQPYRPSEDDRRAGRLSDARLARVIEFMQSHLSQPITITEMANVAAISPFHFCRVFRDALGVSPQRYMTQQRMLAARSMLTATDLSIAEIAAACGFRRASAFSVAFSRRFGVAPAEFRGGQTA